MGKSHSKNSKGCITPLLWIVFFPIMLTITIFRSRMGFFPKVLFTVAIWSIVLVVSNNLNTGKMYKAKKEQTSLIQDEVTSQLSIQDSTNTPDSDATIHPEPTVFPIDEGVSVTEDKDDLSQTKIESSEPTASTTTEASIEYKDASILNGRGYVDVAGFEPSYVGFMGYAAVYSDLGLEDNQEYSDTPWDIPVFQRTENGFEPVGTIEHKTKIGIISQELTKKNGKEYSGYLEYIDIDKGDVGYIDVIHFATIPYWTGSITNAVEKGYVLASFEQNSKYTPILSDGKKVMITDKTTVLLPAKGTYYVSVSDKVNYSVLGVVAIEKNEKIEMKYVFFNMNDLRIIY